MSRIASSNLFDILGEDDAPEEVVKPVSPVQPAAAKGGAKKPVVAASAAAPARQSEPAKDAQAEDPSFKSRSGSAPRQGGRPPRENTKNDRHVARNGNNRDISKNGGGRGNWGSDLDENRAQGPNSKKIAEEPVAEPEAIVAAPAADAVAPAADAAAAAAPAAAAEPEKPQEPDPADKFIGLDEFLAQKEAKRVADDLNIKVRDVIVDDKQFKHIRSAVSEKSIIENSFSDLKVAKKGKKEKAANKRAQAEAIDMYPVGIVNNAPRAERPQGDRPPRTEGGEFRGSGRGRGGGGFRGGRGRGAGGARGGGSRGTNLRLEDFPSLVGAQPVQ